MNAPFSALNTQGAIDSRLEQIFEAAVNGLQAGESIDVEALVAAHPEYAAELRELWPTVARLARIGNPSRVFPPGSSANGNADTPHRQIGEFRLIREIGRGGMGTVFEAEQPSMGRRVALKVLPFAAMVQDKSLQRFHNEVRAAAALDHPNIVSIYSVGEDRGVHFYAMRLVHGRTLADLIVELREAATYKIQPGRSNGDGRPIDSLTAASTTQRIVQARLSTVADSRRTADDYRMVARVGIQAAEALQHAHDLGVLHRDIKPSNLLLDREGKLYVTDFGLARIEADAGLTMTGDIVGTLRYMAPEQALAKQVVIDHRADIYSLGATLYELLTLKPAFSEPDRGALIKQIAFDDPPPIRKIARRVPAELETIVQKAMAKNRDERYETAQRLGDDLRAFLESRPIKARPISPLGRLRKWAARHQTPVAISAAALVLLSAVLTVGMFRLKQSETRAIAALKETSELLYQSDVALAFETFEKGRPAEAEQTLSRRLPTETIPDTRDFAWYLLQSAVEKPPSISLLGHQGAVNEIAVFPDRDRIASVGEDGTLRIWDVVTRKLLRTFQLGSEPLYSVAVSNDGRFVAAASKTVYLCELSTGSVHEIFRSEHNIESLAFRADGAQIAAGSRYHDVFLITRSGELVGRVPCSSRVCSLAFVGKEQSLMFPNRSVAADGHDGPDVIELWRNDLSATEKVLRLPEELGSLTVARPIGDSRYILVGDRYGHRAHIMDRTSGQVVASIRPNRDKLIDLDVMPGGDYIAICYGDGVIDFHPLDVRPAVPTFGHRPRSFRAHQGEIFAIRFIGNNQLVSCGADGVIKVWDLADAPTHNYYFADLKKPRSVSLSPDASSIAVLGNKGHVILRNGRIVDKYIHGGYSPSFCEWSPAGDRLAIALKRRRVWLDHYGKKVSQVEPSTIAKGLAFSPFDRLIAIIGEQHIQLFNTESGKLVAEQPLHATGEAVAFSHDGKCVAHAGDSDRITISDVPKLRPQRELLNGPSTRSIALSLDDRVLATGHYGGMVRLFDVKTGRMRAELTGHTADVVDVAFSPDGRTLLSCDGEEVRVWSVDHATCYGVFCNAADRMSLSADGRALAVADSDLDGTMIWLWKINLPR